MSYWSSPNYVAKQIPEHSRLVEYKIRSVSFWRPASRFIGHEDLMQLFLLGLEPPQVVFRKTFLLRASSNLAPVPSQRKTRPIRMMVLRSPGELRHSKMASITLVYNWHDCENLRCYLFEIRQARQEYHEYEVALVEVLNNL